MYSVESLRHKPVVGGVELRISHTEETARFRALVYYCRQDTSERLDIICSGAVSRTLAWWAIVDPLLDICDDSCSKVCVSVMHFMSCPFVQN